MALFMQACYLLNIKSENEQICCLFSCLFFYFLLNIPIEYFFWIFLLNIFIEYFYWIFLWNISYRISSQRMSKKLVYFPVSFRTNHSTLTFTKTNIAWQEKATLKEFFLYYLLCWTARSQTFPLRFWFFMQVFLLKCREYDCVFILLWWSILTDFLQPSKVTFWSIISNVMNQWRDKKYLLNATVKVFVADQQ